MMFKFWDRLTPAPSGDCKHLWSNWSEPAVMTRMVYRYGRGEDETHEVSGQERRCLHCNMVERREV